MLKNNKGFILKTSKKKKKKSHTEFSKTDIILAVTLIVVKFSNPKKLERTFKSTRM